MFFKSVTCQASIYDSKHTYKALIDLLQPLGRVARQIILPVGYLDSAFTSTLSIEPVGAVIEFHVRAIAQVKGSLAV